MSIRKIVKLMYEAGTTPDLPLTNPTPPPRDPPGEDPPDGGPPTGGNGEDPPTEEKPKIRIRRSATVTVADKHSCSVCESYTKTGGCKKADKVIKKHGADKLARWLQHPYLKNSCSYHKRGKRIMPMREGILSEIARPTVKRVLQKNNLWSHVKGYHASSGRTRFQIPNRSGVITDVTTSLAAVGYHPDIVANTGATITVVTR